ncbi:MAG: aminoacyl-tRNA deacylase [bacterium]|jgi:Ala-tRNA(Pro) deacylase
MAIIKVKDFLDSHNVRYVTITHSPAFTAQQIAASAHIPGKNMAKVVMVKIDGKMTMAVLPASYNIDFDLLKDVTGADHIELASESEFMNLFPNCEAGAMPPFGNLYGIDVLVAESLAEDEEIVFNACSHRDLIKINYRDFERLVNPKVISFSALRH